MTAISTTPTEMIVRSDDAELYVRAAGGGPSGETLIVLSGGPGLSHEYLVGLLELASADLQVVLYDQRGVGRSTGQIKENLLDNQVKDLVAVQEALGVRRAHLAGHSGGGLLVMLAVQQRPDLVASTIVIDSAPPTRGGLDAAMGSLSGRIHELAEAGVIVLPDDQTDQTAWVRAALPAYFYDPRHTQARAHGGVTLTGSVYAATLDAFGDYDLTDVVRTLDVPALVIACGVPFGTTMGMAVAGELSEALTDIHVWDECGHLPWLESPERLMGAIRSFLVARCGVDTSAREAV